MKTTMCPWPNWPRDKTLPKVQRRSNDVHRIEWRAGKVELVVFLVTRRVIVTHVRLFANHSKDTLADDRTSEGK